MEDNEIGGSFVQYVTQLHVSALF